MQDLTNDTIVHIKKDGMEYIQFRKLLEYQDNVQHCYTLKRNLFFGNTSNYVQEEKRIRKDTLRLCNSLGVSYQHIIRPFEAHTSNIIYTNDIPNYEEELVYSKKYLGIDGVITDQKDLSLLLLSRDCISIFLFDPVKKVIGNIHSGWQGVWKKIVMNAIEKMKEKGCNPNNIIACIAPSLRKCHFEVHRDLQAVFHENFQYTGRIQDIIEPIGLKQGREKWRIDLVLLTSILLEEAGLLPKNIIDSKLCTLCQKESFYTYRGSKESSNNVALITLK